MGKSNFKVGKSNFRVGNSKLKVEDFMEKCSQRGTEISSMNKCGFVLYLINSKSNAVRDATLY